MKYIKKFERNDLEEYNVVNYIYNKIMEDVKLLMDRGDFNFNEKFIIFDIYLLEYGHLVFLLSFESIPGNCGFGLAEQSKLPFIIIPRIKESKISGNIEEYEDGIKHEISHFLDYKKSGKKLSNTSNFTGEVYFNDVQEINAYYTQGINKLIKWIKTSKSNRVLRCLNNFNMFREEYYDNLNSVIRRLNSTIDIKAFLTDKSKKRIDKRLYDLWIKLN
jgi:hypothetical protein